jgi:hypothetical protein
MSNILIGSDPEFFLNKDGKMVSAEGLIGGSKHSPILLPIGAMQEDNVMVEFNIPPALSQENFTTSISEVLSFLKNEVIPDYEHLYIPSAEFDETMLKSEQARTFGCEPDFNVWLQKNNISPKPEQLGNLRVAGGHVHIGCGGLSYESRITLGKKLDLFLGVPSLLLDEDDRRRDYYGKAGSIRQKEYGLEYRTLSNFWLNSKEMMNWVYANAIKAVKYTGDVKDSVVDIINNADRNAAKNLISEYKIAMPNG